MKPIHQTLFGNGENGTQRGNCFAACIASLLELPLEEVPNFCTKCDWREAANLWLASRGLFYVDLKLPGDLRDEHVRFWGYHVISGMSVRNIRHSVVGFGGKTVFDPHPSGAGLIEGDWEYGFLIPQNPARKNSRGTQT